MIINATTAILPEVFEAMVPYLTTEWGNPSNTYKFGSKLKKVIETARHIVTSSVEHSSVLNYCRALEKEEFRVTYLPVDREGLLKLADLDLSANIVSISRENVIGNALWWRVKESVKCVLKSFHKECLHIRLKSIFFGDVFKNVAFDLGDLRFNG